MEILFLSNSPGTCNGLRMGTWASRLMLVSLILAAIGSAYAGYRFGLNKTAAQSPSIGLELKDLERTLRGERGLLDDSRQELEANLNALARQLGQMQGRLIRLDALGARLVEVGKLDPEEFDFAEPSPPMGGPEAASAISTQSYPELMEAMAAVSRQLDDREQKLDVLEGLLVNRRLQEDSSPSGRPIRKGWISSYYGNRTDPVTGKKAFHEGLDFAGRKGSDVMSVAAGVVTWVGKKQGYGNVIEITHSDGLATRYAHNQKNLVKVGERVDKGQVIALMGSSGRSTGPHVHLEVLRNGRPVNPLRYVRKTAG